jgi:hypothetical protein
VVRRRELKGAALGVLGSFVSRCNDVEGYWGMGKLYRLAQKNGVSRVEIDLLAATMRPSNSAFDPMIEQFAFLLCAQLQARRLPRAWVTKASVSIDFDSSTAVPQLFETAPLGDTFDCAAIVIDDLGKERSARTSGRCWVHDPARESRRHRSDWHRRGGSAPVAG